MPAPRIIRWARRSAAIGQPTVATPSERFVLLLPVLETMPTETTLTATEAGRILGHSDPTYTYRLLRAGTLVGRRVGGRWLVNADSVEQRRQRMDQAARSKANAAAEREKRKAEIRARYAKP
jgi:excisionase family DNA binding protein